MTKLNATNPRKSASQERAKMTVEAILDATARVLVREGYARTSTNRIATVAGVSIGSLYQYFPNKESLVAALVARHNRKILSLLENTMQECTSEDLNSTMRELVRAMIAAYRVDPELHRILMEEVPRIGKLAEVEAIRKDMLHLVRYYLDQCKDNVELKDLNMAAFICATTVEALTHAIVLNDCSHVPSDEATIVEHITRMIAGYLGTTHSLSVVA